MKNDMLHNHSDVPPGDSRLDAFRAILNQALLATGVEWNGSQSNTSIGALVRNIGEVIGVFGDIDTETKKWLGFTADANCSVSRLSLLPHANTCGGDN